MRRPASRPNSKMNDENQSQRSINSSNDDDNDHADEENNRLMSSNLQAGGGGSGIANNNNGSVNGMENTNNENDDDDDLLETPRLSDTNVPRVCCALLASIVTGGVTYAFGLYGAALKRTLRLTQTQLDTISSANFCAGLLSWLPGMFVDRFGTRYGITLGGITGSASLLLYWAVATKIIAIADKNVIVTILSILGVTTFLSCALITGSVFKVISCYCGPGTKGSAVGVAKGYVGLGSGAFACLFESIRSPTSSDLDFLPMGAFFFIVCATIPSWCFMEQKPVPDVMTPLHFRVLYMSLLSLAVVVVGTSLLNLYEEKKAAVQATARASETNYPMAAVIVAVWIGPLIAQLFLPQKLESHSYAVLEQEQDSLLPTDDIGGGGDGDGGIDCNNLSAQRPLTLDPVDPMDKEDSSSHSMSESNADEMEERGSPRPDQGVRDKNLFQMLLAPSAWVLLWISTIVVGGGTVETNNMGQMVESLGFPAVVTSASLALFSVAQSGGRVLTGVISENALNWNTRQCCIDKGIPRPFFLILTSLVGVVAHTILAAFTDQTSFVIGTFLSGLSFGGVWPMLVLIVGEIFGTAHVGANYMFYDGFTSAGGTFLLSKVVAQKVYESHVDHHYSENSDEVTCYGQDCFRATHVIISLLLLTCVAMSGVFMYTTRHVYNKPNLHIH